MGYVTDRVSDGVIYLERSRPTHPAFTRKPGPPPPLGLVSGNAFIDWTDADFLAFGEDCDKRHESGLVDGRPCTNIEMSAMIRWRRHEFWRKAELEGCDCEGPRDNGTCRKQPGMCIYVKAAYRLMGRSEND